MNYSTFWFSHERTVDIPIFHCHRSSFDLSRIGSNNSLYFAKLRVTEEYVNAVLAEVKGKTLYTYYYEFMLLFLLAHLELSSLRNLLDSLFDIGLWLADARQVTLSDVYESFRLGKYIAACYHPTILLKHLARYSEDDRAFFPVLCSLLASEDPNTPRDADITYLRVGLQSFLSLDLRQFPNLVCLELEQSVYLDLNEEKKLFSRFCKHLSSDDFLQSKPASLCHVLLPSDLYPQLLRLIPNIPGVVFRSPSWRHRTTESNDQRKLALSLLGVNFKDSMSAVSTPSSLSSSTEAAAAATEPDDDIWVAQNTSSSMELGEKKPPTYEYKSSGQWLQGKRYVRLTRTVLDSALGTREYTPADLDQLPVIPAPDVLTSESLAALKAGCSPLDVLAQFSIELKAGSWTRLQSIDACEIFCLADRLADVRLVKGDDGFIYARSEQDLELHYVVKAGQALSQAEAVEALPGLLKFEMNKYLKDDRYQFFQPPNQTLPAYQDPEQYLVELYEGRLGACAERAQSVLAHLYRIFARVPLDASASAVEFILKNPYFSVCICRVNGDHQILEVSLTDGKVIQIDLGGGSEAEQVFEKEQASKAEPASQASFFPPTKKEPEAATSAPVQKEPSIQADLGRLILKAAEPQRICLIEELYRLLDPEMNQSNRPSLLIGGEHCEALSHVLLSKARDQQLPCYVLRNLSDLDSHRWHLSLEEDQARLSHDSGVIRFIKIARQCPDRTFVLLVDWESLPSYCRAQLNTLLDPRPTLCGESVPVNVLVIGSCKTLPTDMSFLTRHKTLIDASAVVHHSWDFADVRQEICCDFAGRADFLYLLFGRIEASGVWHKSEYVRHLESLAASNQPARLRVLNLPIEARAAFKQDWARARALGYWDWQGYRIPVQHIVLDCGEGGFDFRGFPERISSLKKEVCYLQLPSGVFLLNTYNFDSLLHQNVLDESGEMLSCGSGYLAQAREAGNDTVCLWVSSNLSDTQWYCLYREAQLHGLSLNLELAPGLVLPKILETMQVQSFEQQSFVTSAQPTVVLCQHANDYLGSIEIPPGALILDVEDYTIADLAESIYFKTGPQGFSGFKRLETAVLQALNLGRPVILKGRFSAAQLAYWQTYLLSDFLLQLIVEHPDPVAARSSFAYLPSAAILSWQGAPAAPLAKVLYEAVPTESEFLRPINLSGIEQVAQNFMNQRLAQLQALLTDSPVIQICGETGVGKSRLMDTLEQTGIRVYRGWKAFLQFLEDKEHGQKVWLLDEMNIDAKHLTMLAPLFRGDKEILYEGKLYPISDQHRVILLGNDLTYGAGRVKQKLLSDYTVTQWHLQCFPKEYILNNLLLPIYRSANIDNKDEKLFVKSCLMMMERRRGTSESIGQRIRDWQAWALGYCLKKLRTASTANPEAFYALPKQDAYVELASNREAREKIRHLLRLKQAQARGDLPDAGQGVNAVWLAGSSGIGKSRMIEAMLFSEGYKLLPSMEALKHYNPAQRGRYFFKLDASVHPSLKREVLALCYEKGVMIWFDEADTCIDREGLERPLNLLLTGDHPEGGSKAEFSGCAVLFSANGGGFENRGNISPALAARCDVCELPALTKAENQAILMVYLNREQSFQRLDAEQAQSVAKFLNDQVLEFQDSHPKLGLRQCLQHLPQLIELAVDVVTEKPEASLVPESQRYDKQLFGGV